MEFETKTLNTLVALTKASDVIDNWGFFQEGLAQLNKTAAGKMFMPEELFLKLIFHVLSQGQSYGLVALMRNKNGKNVGFFIVKDDTEKFFLPTALVWAAYSTNNNTSVTRDMVRLGEEWARAQGYQQLFAVCLRTGSAIKHLYTKKWKFKLHGLLFQKDL